MLPSGADGARVEVSASRAFERLEAQWEAVGNRLRAPAPLRAGVHFWRLFARRGASVDATPGPVWEFAVPGEVINVETARVIRDLNGDGLDDDVTARSAGSPRRWQIEVRLGRTGGMSTTPDQVIPSELADAPDCDTPAFWIPAVTHIGDVNLDGYGDVGVVLRRRYLDVGGCQHNNAQYDELLIYYGGPDGLLGTPFNTTRLGRPQRHSYDPPQEIARVTPVADSDGDGFGELLSVFFGGASPASEIFSPRTTYWDGGPPEAAGHAYLEWVYGDFNADGLTERAHAAVDPFSGVWFYGLPWFAGGAPAREQPRLRFPTERCGTSRHPDVPYVDAVLDANDDGYDDLRVLSVWAFSEEATLLYLGGPDGLSILRCRVISVRARP